MTLESCRKHAAPVRRPASTGPALVKPPIASTTWGGSFRKVENDRRRVTIGSDGVVSVTQPGSAAPNQVGTIQLADFVNPTGLQPIGQNLFVETGASGTPQTGSAGQNGMGTISQGMLETSNVNTVEELVNMIETQRAYEMNSKAISTAGQMLQYANNNL